MNISFLIDDEYKEILIDNEYENDKNFVNNIKSCLSKEYADKISQYKVTYVCPDILKTSLWEMKFNNKYEMETDCDLNELIMDY